MNLNKLVIKESRDPNSATVGVFPDVAAPGQYKYWPDEDDPDYIGDQINENFAQFRMQLNSGNSYFHGLALGAQKRLGYGLSTQLSYNYSRLIDQGSGVTNQGDELNQGQRGIYGYDMYMKKGPSIMDVPHSFVTNFSYELPQGDFGGFGNAILNGWQMNGIVTLSKGGPMSIYDESDEREDRIAENEDARPDLIPGGNHNPIEGTSAGCDGVAAGQKLGTPEMWYDPCQFVPAQPGFFGTLGKNTIRTPGVVTFDWSVFKDFNISETSHITFKAEFFNLFNHPNYRLPSSQLFRSSSTAASPRRDTDTLGFDADGSGTHQITQTRTSARQIQFGLRFVF